MRFGLFRSPALCSFAMIMTHVGFVSTAAAQTPLPQGSAAPYLYVVTQWTDPGSGTAGNCPDQNAVPVVAGPNCTLRDALAAAAATASSSRTATVTFAATSATTITLTSGNVLALPAYTTVQGATTGSGSSLTNLVTVDGSLHQIFTAASNATSTVLNNLIVIHGGAPSTASGSAVFNQGTLSISNSTFSGNTLPTGSSGGAIYNSGTLTITGSALTSNTITSGGFGGAIYNMGTLNVRGCTFAANAAGLGGAIYNNAGGVLIVDSSTITANTGSTSSGGIYNGNASTAISNSILTGNTGGNCAGLGCSSTYPAAYLSVSGSVGSTSGNIIITVTDSQGHQFTETGGYGSASLSASVTSLFGAYFARDYYNSGLTAQAFGSVLEFQLTNGASFQSIAVTNPSSFTIQQINLDSVYSNTVLSVSTALANLSSPGNYGGPTQTVMPLPGSIALCAINPSTATGQDQRGQPRTTSYSGVACQDAGAVQTNYSLAFVQQPSSAFAGVAIAPTPTVQLSESGAALSVAGAPISVAATSGTLNGTTSQNTAATGIASFSGLSIGTAQSGDALKASIAVGSHAIAVTSNAFNVLGFDHFGISASSTATAGTSTAVTVRAYSDAAGTILDTQYSGTVTISTTDAAASLPPQLGLAAGSGTLNVTFATAGTQTVTATAGSASVTSPAISVSPGAAYTIAVVSGTPQSAQVSSAFAPLIVKVTDLYHNVIPNTPVNFSAPGTGASATLSASSTTTASDGTARTTPTANTTAGTYNVSATATAIPAGNSVTFVLTNTPPPGYSVTANPTSLTISRGSSGTSTIAFTPVSGYAGTATMTCSGLPALATCQFSPATITFTGNNAVQTTMLTVATVAPSSRTGATSAMLFLFPGVGLALLVALRRRQLSDGLRPLLFAVLLAVSFGLVGCSGGTNTSNPGTPTGTSTVQVAVTATGATGSGMNNINQSVSLTLTIQ